MSTNNEKASVSIQCHFAKGEQGISPMLLCDQGDIYQNYLGSTSSPQCVPDFSASSALVEMWLSKADGSIAAAADLDGDVEWYVGAQQLTFNASTKKCTTPVQFKDIFQRVDPSGNTKPGLKIIGNLVTPLSGLSSTLKAVATITDANGKTVRKSASLPITITPVTEDSYSISIRALSGELAITANDQTLQVTATAYNALTPLAFGSDYKLVWDYLDAGTWKRRAEKSGSPGVIEIKEKEVQSCMLVRVALCRGAAVTTANYTSLQYDDPDAANYVQPLAIDTAVVYDTSDPYVINPNPSPADCTLGDGISATKITFSPVMERRDGTPAPGTVQLSAQLLSMSGVVMRSVAAFAQGGSFDVLKADFNQSSDINVNIDGTCTITV